MVKFVAPHIDLPSTRYYPSVTAENLPKNQGILTALFRVKRLDVTNVKTEKSGQISLDFSKLMEKTYE
ncbi:hypothetical protein [Rodentibacter sp. Ppn85]|uniref:hypothetical protein n=1 Tax=Rodentibacter sp. Ppn85 TaxID=1908525 RepID=UPI0009842F9B|nr:hypothetical protein [Rodentibacter sp. Ppn85]OOF60349.1 hypothetical protein BKL51_11450 [Rodentibacter sp. Ppn85]